MSLNTITKSIRRKIINKYCNDILMAQVIWIQILLREHLEWDGDNITFRYYHLFFFLRPKKKKVDFISKL
jgi:hypothetical protein